MASSSLNQRTFHLLPNWAVVDEPLSRTPSATSATRQPEIDCHLRTGLPIVLSFLPWRLRLTCTDGPARRLPPIFFPVRGCMRAVVLCATLAALSLPSVVGAQSASDRSRRARTVSPESLRAGPAVRYRRGEGGRRGGQALAEPAAHLRPGVSRGCARRHVYGEPGVAGHRPPRVRGRRGQRARGCHRHRADEALRRARADLRLAFAQLVAAQTREQEMTAAAARIRNPWRFWPNERLPETPPDSIACAPSERA